MITSSFSCNIKKNKRETVRSKGEKKRQYKSENKMGEVEDENLMGM